MSNIYIYDVGEFRHKIELQINDTVKIGGRPVQDWKTVHTTRAKTYKNNKTTTTEGEQGDTDKVVKRILIRTPKKLEITNDLRVIFKGKPYKIKSSTDIRELGIYTEIIIERLE